MAQDEEVRDTESVQPLMANESQVGTFNNDLLHFYLKRLATTT